MRPVLKAALHPLWRDPASVQLRLDPERALVLEGLDPSERLLLLGLDGTLDTRTLEEGTAPPGAPVDASRVRRLLALLVEAGVVDDAGGPPPALRRWPLQHQARLAPDLAALALRPGADHDGGAAVLEARAARWVQVQGAGRLGSAVARLLAAAGIGRVTVQDDGRTGWHDLSPAGLTLSDVGAPRGWATERACARDSPLPPLRPGALPDEEALPEEVVPPARQALPDLVVLAPHVRPDAEQVERLVRDGVAHLPVTMRETAVLVGPLVLPGLTACLRCLDLHRSDRDPGWPLVAAQLLQLEQSGHPEQSAHAEHAQHPEHLRGGHDDRRIGPRVPACDVVLAGIGAASAAALVLAHLDGEGPGPAHDATLEFTLPFGLPQARGWSPHPQCGCRWDADLLDAALQAG